jgi:hypothetical protein
MFGQSDDDIAGKGAIVPNLSPPDFGLAPDITGLTDANSSMQEYAQQGNQILKRRLFEKLPGQLHLCADDIRSFASF